MILRRSTILADARATRRRTDASRPSTSSVVRVGAVTGDTYVDDNGVKWMYDTDKFSPPYGQIRAYTNGYGDADVYSSWYDRDFSGDSSALQSWIRSYAIASAGAVIAADETTDGGGSSDSSGGGGGGTDTKPSDGTTTKSGTAKPKPPTTAKPKPPTGYYVHPSAPPPSPMITSASGGTNSNLLLAGFFALVAVGAVLFL